jgi:uncharacterized protein (TIGR03083 family)
VRYEAGHAFSVPVKGAGGIRMSDCDGTGGTNSDVEPAALLATVPSSSAALAEAAVEAGLDTPVPTCPGWSVERLVDHAGKVLRVVAKVVETGGPVDGRTLPKPPAGPLVVQWFTEMASATVATLSALDPEDELWNWAGAPPVAAFWYRRMAHEMVVHGTDAALAAGRSRPIDAALAADGIDELLTVLLPAKVAMGGAGVEGLGSLHVHCTDAEGEWLVAPAGSSLEVTRTHAKGDAALRGPAAELLLRLYNRGGGGEVVGDADVVTTFTSRFTF